MKLQHLAIGARFEYEGIVYVKTGPLTASSELGGQRVIPRYATLKPLDVPAVDRCDTVKTGLDRARVVAAFESFYACAVEVTDAGGRERLAGAREAFLAALRS